MVKRLEQLNNGEFKMIKPKRIYPKMIKSVVDKSSFMPNVNDARNLLTSEKIGSPVTALYDFYNGETKGIGNHQIQRINDITEIDKAIEIQTKIANENITDAVSKGKKIIKEQIKKAEKQTQTQTQTQTQGGNT